MRVTVNGETEDIPEGTTVSGLLRARSIREARVAVEVNLEVIRKEHREERVLVEGDTIEIVSFVGGGA